MLIVLLESIELHLFISELVLDHFKIIFHLCPLVLHSLLIFFMEEVDLLLILFLLGVDLVSQLILFEIIEVLKLLQGLL